MRTRGGGPAADPSLNADGTAIQGGKLRLEVDLPAPPTKPGITGKVVLIASAWN